MAVAVVMVLAGACSEGERAVGAARDGLQAARDGMQSAANQAQSAAFCEAVQKVQSGAVGPQAVEALSDVIATNAPVEIRSEADAFLAQARRASAALAAARASATGSELDAALESLSPEDRQFLTGLASAAATGALPGGPTGIIFEFARQNC